MSRDAGTSWSERSRSEARAPGEPEVRDGTAASDSDPGSGKPRRGITRRRLLLGAAAGAGLLVVGAPIGLDRGRPWLAETVLERGTGAPTLPEPLVWFELTDSSVALYVPKIEMGQGVHTAFAQIALEELALDPAQLLVRQADTGRGFAADAQFTFGSTSVATMYTPLREAAAAVQAMLAAEAAARLQTSPDRLDAASGRFTVRGTDSSLTFGQVVAGKTGAWTLPEQPPPLRARGEFTRIGTDLRRTDMRDKLTGAAVYSYDARVPGMRYGAVAHPPRFGARLRGFTGPQPGDAHVVFDAEANFLGVVAATRTRAWQVLAGLDLAWDGGTDTDSAALDAMLHATSGAVVRRDGNVDRALAALDQGTVIEAAYRTPLAHHAHLEPVAALVAIDQPQPGRTTTPVRAWVGTQAPGAAAEALTELLGDDHSVTVYPTMLGGSFGRKGSQDAALDAARLARAVGAPVHVGWSRTQDLRNGLYRPPTHTRLRGGVDAAGRIRGVEQHSASGDIIWVVAGLPELVRDTLGFDPGTLMGQFLPYAIEGYRVVNQREQLPVPTGPWRGLGVYANVFALESFVDELAAAAGVDPVQFRLQNLPDDDAGRRLRAVLQRAADEAGWSAPSGSGSGEGMGVAICLDHDTAVAQVAHVAVAQGRIDVRRVVVAVDPGLVIDPAGARLQSVGSVVMGLSSALVERLEVSGGAVTQGNFDDYPILTMERTPPIDVHLIESDDRPRGMGEPVLGPVAAAVANAVFAATGQRLRTLPLTLG